MRLPPPPPDQAELLGVALVHAMSSVPGCVKATKPFRTEAEFSLYSTDSENQV